MLQGEVSEIEISGETSDISQLYEHVLYDWFIFMEETIKYPDENTVLGRYLGPAIYVGPAIVANIMKGNGEVVNRLTYCGLKENKKSNQIHISSMKDFDNITRENLGHTFHDMTFQMSFWRRNLFMTYTRMIPQMRRVVWKTRVTTLQSL